MSAQLQFSVSNQQITRTDNFNVVSDSVDYLYAQFAFLTDEWSGRTKTAQFRSDKSSTIYEVILDDDGTCLVPHEALADASYLYVTVFAGQLITVNKATVFVEKTGYSADGESSTPPTPSVYQQILDKLDEVEAYVDDKVANIDGGLFTDWQEGE